jgi:hypothetical protein
MRVLVGSIEHPFDDVYALDKTTKAAILDKDSYVQGRLFGADRRTHSRRAQRAPSLD